MNAYDLAKKYYPEFWDISRLKSLVQKGKLTPEQYEEITGEKYSGGDA